jgi:hypothetical protein
MGVGRFHSCLRCHSTRPGLDRRHARCSYRRCFNLGYRPHHSIRLFTSLMPARLLTSLSCGSSAQLSWHAALGCRWDRETTLRTTRRTAPRPVRSLWPHQCYGLQSREPLARGVPTQCKASQMPLQRLSLRSFEHSLPSARPVSVPNKDK